MSKRAIENLQINTIFHNSAKPQLCPTPSTLNTQLYPNFFTSIGMTIETNKHPTWLLTQIFDLSTDMSKRVIENVQMNTIIP